MAVYFIQAWRWRTLLEPVIRLGFWRTSQAIFVGLFANEVLPLRTGELIRCYLLAHWNNLRISLSFASAAVERVIDGVVLVACFLFTAGMVRGIPEELTILVRILGGCLILLSFALLWLIRRKLDSHPAFQESKWSATFRHVVEGLHLMGNRADAGQTSGHQRCFMWRCNLLSLWAVMKAYELDLSDVGRGGRSDDHPPMDGRAECAGESRISECGVCGGAEGSRRGTEGGDDVFDHSVRGLDAADRDARGDCDGADGVEYYGIAEAGKNGDGRVSR